MPQGPVAAKKVYPREVRSQAVALHAQGWGTKRIGRRLHIDSSTVKEWLRRWRAYGAESLSPYWRVPRADADGDPRRDERFAEPLRLYVETDLSVREICRRCGLEYGSFYAWLARRAPGQVASRRAARQEAALRACEDPAYLEFSDTQLARLYHLTSSQLKALLQERRPGVLEWRGQERRRMGMTRKPHHGERSSDGERCALAAEHLRSSDDTIAGAAARYRLSPAALRKHLVARHKDLAHEVVKRAAASR